jgi:hypothetical protein
MAVAADYLNLNQVLAPSLYLEASEEHKMQQASTSQSNKILAIGISQGIMPVLFIYLQLADP